MFKKNLIKNNNVKLYESQPIHPNNSKLHSLVVPISGKVKDPPPPYENEEIKQQFDEESTASVVSTASVNMKAPSTAAASSSSGSGSSGTVTYDTSANKSCSVYNFDDNTAYAIFTDQHGTVTLSKCPRSTLTWSSPQTLGGFGITSSPHLCYTPLGYPVLIGAGSGQIYFRYLGSSGGNSDLGVSMQFPSGTTNIQGIYAYNNSGDDMAQIAIVNQSGQLLTMYVTFETNKVKVTAWSNWGSQFQGAPCIGSSSNTAWFIVKNMSSSRPKMVYSWCYLNDPTNYGRWHNMNQLKISDFVGSPTIARASQMNTHQYSGIYLTFFARTNNNSIAFARCTSSDGYPSSSFIEQDLGFQTELDIQFPLTSVNTTPLLTIANGSALASGYTISSKVLDSFQVLPPSQTVTYLSSLLIPLGPSGPLNTPLYKIYVFVKTSSGENITIDYSTTLLPQYQS